MIDEDRDLTPAEAAELLRISVKAAHDMCRRGDLPARKIGKLWRIKVAILRHRHPDLWAEMCERDERRDRPASQHTNENRVMRF